LSYLNSNYVTGAISSGQGWALYALGGLRALNLFAYSIRYTSNLVKNL
jgi:hypothetical protein